MDQEIRNKLRNVVTKCRKLLEDDISEVLEGKYGIFAKKDQVAADPNAKMTHLTEEEQAARKDVLDHFAHIRARGFKPKDALDQLVREIAFTHLNRLCAYKMMEAREVYVGGQKFREAVSRGVNSNGVKFYLAEHPEEERLFNTGHQDVAYRHFLDWLGGLLSDEIGVLFNPNDPANRLYPRQKTLDEVLNLLSGGGIKPEEAELREAWPKIWSQDETIGWVYQYFTPKELRDQARKESQAPRNSYELAFRNQFFTPRYVVEFLTDNTLGRIWYEMRKGDTRLKDQCRYMVRRPTEIFMKEGEQPPEDAAEGRDELSQEELLKLPVYIPHRPKKDPRELKILDPACGSGHFLLYCFDLLLTIYEEAYADPELGPALQRDFPKREDLWRDVPRLILANNLHGIDIDLRASQIAALALWLRCQRAYQEMGLKKDRPKITRSNFVCAEPMPGEEHMLKEFVSQLEPKLLGQLVEVVFKKMELAGEAGSLLKIEEEIRDAVAAAKKQWIRETTHATDRKGQPLLFTQAVMDRLAGKTEQPSLFDLTDITDNQFFEQAESKVIEVLRQYAEKAQNGQRLQRRLFMEDAVRGFAFVDLCHRRFDVVLMNPPFGLPTNRVFTLLKQSIPQAYTNMYAAFLMRSGDFCTDGIVGAITSRSFLMTPRLTNFRQDFLLNRLQLVIDLGLSVMDEAEVESCAYTLSASKPINSPILACDLRLLDDKQHYVEMIGKGHSDQIIAADVSVLQRLPGSRILYALSQHVIRLFSSDSVFSPTVGTARCGGRTFDNFRFLRVHWEVAPHTIGTDAIWVPFCKGGDFSPYYGAIPLLIKWENDGKEISQKNIEVNGQTAQARQASSYYFRKGGTYSRRSKAFGVRVMPKGCIFGEKGPAVFSEGEIPESYIIGWLNTRFIRQLVEMQANKSQYDTGSICRLPWRSPANSSAVTMYSRMTTDLVDLSRSLYEWVETDHSFEFCANAVNIHELAQHRNLKVAMIRRQIEELRGRWNEYVETLYGISASDIHVLEADLAIAMDADYDESETTESIDSELPEPEVTHDATTRILLSVCIGVTFGRWDVRQIVIDASRRHDSDPFSPLAPQAPIGLPNTMTKVDSLLLVKYPIRIDGDGILSDDPDHPDDIIRRVRDVLEFIWKDRSDAIEREACSILDVKEMRDYFRKPGKGGFWDDHVSRYSKSRRKAPIYWLLQSTKKNYALWLYYHRLDDDLLFKALVNYVEPKIRLESSSLETLRSQKAAAGESGTGAKRLAKEIERQEDFLSELRDFEDKLRRAANLHLEPDLNDGVVLNIAPLHELVPWKEAKKYWYELLEGRYEWSSIGKQLHLKGLVKC